VQSNGNANYNALQVQVRTTGWHGLFTKTNFTWSHNLDDMTSNSGTLPQNSFNLKGDYGNSSNDRRLQLNAYVVYDIRASRHGPKWLTHGWEASSVMIFHSGPPITPSAASDTTGTGENVLYANYVGGDAYASGSHDVVNANPSNGSTLPHSRFRRPALTARSDAAWSMVLVSARWISLCLRAFLSGRGSGHSFTWISLTCSTART